MFFRILKHDLKRKKAMNIILLLFIILATIFSSSGINNIITVMNGTDYYFDLAGIGDYIVVAQKADGSIDKIFDEEPAIKSYSTDEYYFIFENNLTVNGQKIETKHELFVQSLENSSIHFFDKDDKELIDVPEGEAYITGNFIEDNNLSIGDEITIDYGNTKISLKIAGIAKDALLGSEFMGNSRIIMSDSDYEKINNDESLKNFKGKIFYINTDDTKAVSSALSDVKNILFNYPRSTIKICYVMDMIVACVVLVLSICLIIVSLLILKFTITFSISEEFREIGVMKAIGIKNKKIRSIYIVKYMMLSIIGAIIGYILSIPFGNLMIKSATGNMVLGNYGGITFNIIGAIIIIIITIAFAYFYAGKVKKYSPVDAIRNGQTGERYKKKTIYRIRKSHTRPSLYLAINDILSSPKRFLTIIISFFVCSVFVLGIVITTDTMKSKNLISTFCTESDVYFEPKNITDFYSFNEKEDINEYLDKYSKLFKDNGMSCTIYIEGFFKYKVLFDGNIYNLTCQQGINTKTADYEYTEGTAPINSNEIAITKNISEMTGAKIGDVITIDFGNETKECMVTAYFQSLNQLGEIIRLHKDAPMNFANISHIQNLQANFEDNPSDEEIDNRIEKIKEFLDTEDVFNSADYCAKNIGVVETMEAVQYLLLAITIIVVILVTILMEVSFVTDEKGQIALLKAIGFNDNQIIKWHVYRFGLVALIVEILAVILAKPVTALWCNPIFGMMGANKINYYINPVKVFLIYPGIVFVVTIIVALLASLSTKKIKSSDTANIE